MAGLFWSLQPENALPHSCVYRKPIAPASPWQNGFAERLIGSIRRECVDHIIVLGEAHLRRILKSYARYYNETRTHLALDKDAVENLIKTMPQVQDTISIVGYSLLDSYSASNEPSSAVREMNGYGMAACGAKRTFAKTRNVMQLHSRDSTITL